MQEVYKFVTLVSDGGREVVRTIAFHVVMLDMVVKVRVPRVTHQRISDVWKELVEPGILFREDAVHVDVLVAEERIGAYIPSLHNHMKDCMEPGEAVEEEEGTGNGSCEI